MKTPVLRPIGLALLCCLMVGCFDDGAQLTVEVCGDVEIPQEIDTYRVVVYDAERDKIERSGARELLKCSDDGEESIISLPDVFDFPSVPPDAWIVLEGQRNGSPVMSFERRIRAEEGDEVSVKMGLTRSCLGINCPLGQTCFGDGKCAIIEFDDDRATCKSVEGTQPDPLPAPTEPNCEVIDPLLGASL